MIYKLELKKCPVCKDSFLGSKRKKFCCKECRYEFHNRETSKSRKLSDSARILALNFEKNRQILNNLYFSNRFTYTRLELEKAGFSFHSFTKMIETGTIKAMWIFGNLKVTKSRFSETYEISILCDNDKKENKKSFPA